MGEQFTTLRHLLKQRSLRKIIVLVVLILLFAASVWNWLYNIPVQPNIEIRKSPEARWTIDAANPTEGFIWNPAAGPISCYSLRTGEKLFERSFEDADRVVLCAGDPRTTVVRRGAQADVVDMRTGKIRIKNLPILPGSSFGSSVNGKVLLVHLGQQLRAFDADTGQLMWSRDDIKSFGTVWSGEAEVLFAVVMIPRHVEGRDIVVDVVQLLGAKDGEEDPRFVGSVTRDSWINVPPRYLATPTSGGGGGAFIVHGRAFIIHDLATGKRLPEIRYAAVHNGYGPHFNASGTQVLLTYRQESIGCGLARWDSQTGRVIAPVPPLAVVKTDVTTDDGRYTISVSRTRTTTHILIDNQLKKIVGKIEYPGPDKAFELAPTGDSFIQTCSDRLAIYFLPLQFNFNKLVLGAVYVLASFVLTLLKLLPFIRRFLQDDPRPAELSDESALDADVDSRDRIDHEPPLAGA